MVYIFVDYISVFDCFPFLCRSVSLGHTDSIHMYTSLCACLSVQLSVFVSIHVCMFYMYVFAHVCGLYVLFYMYMVYKCYSICVVYMLFNICMFTFVSLCSVYLSVSAHRSVPMHVGKPGTNPTA